MARKPRRTSRSSIALRWIASAALALIGVLYYQPVRTYIETRDELTQREAAVRALERERDELERRLAASATAETLTREARRLGFVRPGERLFIVKGIDAWRRAHTARHGD
jgi:cell division protein FtsB